VLRPALGAAFVKLDPRVQWRNPVMFVVYVGSLFTTVLWLQALIGHGEAPAWFIGATALWLWFTVLFANFAEALAEGRSKAQAATLRAARQTVMAKKLREPRHDATVETVPGDSLRRGDVVLVAAGDMIPGDGEVIEGVASVNESAITGESAPVIREAGGDFFGRHRWHHGTVGLDRGAHHREPGRDLPRPHDRLGRRRAAPEDAERDRAHHPADRAHADLPARHRHAAAVLAVRGDCCWRGSAGDADGAGGAAGVSDPDHHRRAAVGDRHRRHEPHAGRQRHRHLGRAVEAAGDVDVLLLDKTGTITLGNRQAASFLPLPGVSEQALADAAQLASLADETPEGRSIVVLAKRRFNLRERDIHALHATFVAFSAQTRMSGVDLDGRQIRKGAAQAIRQYVEAAGTRFPTEAAQLADELARRGSTPLVVADGSRVLGVIELKDIVKGGIKERFAELRRMGIKTVMVTGDNPLTAAAIAAEAGVDDFLAEATPEAKLALIRQYQAEGHLVAMTGDGTNDAPALAQADVAVAMHSGTQAAKEAGNMVDLDSNPTKLLEVVAVGKQMLMTRGALTTFSIANDLAKYFAIVPALFVAMYPPLDALNVMHLASPRSAILAAVIFNALIIIALIPLALRGIAYRPASAAVVLRRNLAIYGLGGIALPFIGIKLIDLGLAALGWV